MTTRFAFAGVEMDRITLAEAIDAVVTLVRRGRGGYVFTPNADHIVRVQTDTRLKRAYRHASLSLCDGQPVVWASHLLGPALPERVAGSDLFGPLMARAAAEGLRVFFFGSSPDASREAERRLRAAHPSLQVVGRDCSWWDPASAANPADSPVVAAIRASRADLVVVALGAPRQEYWIAEHAAHLAPAVVLGLGAALDFTAGQVRRAPRWVSDAGLEWLFRLVQEPRRLAHRYLVRDSRLLLLIVDAMRSRLIDRLFQPAMQTARPQRATDHWST